MAHCSSKMVAGIIGRKEKGLPHRVAADHVGLGLTGRSAKRNEAKANKAKHSKTKVVWLFS
eukprot:4980658-Amphidinium_carterae.1